MWSGEKLGYVDYVRFNLVKEFKRVFESYAGFAWESTDDIRSQCKLREGCPEPLYCCFKIICRIESVHTLKHCVVAALHRQVHKLENALAPERVDQFI